MHIAKFILRYTANMHYRTENQGAVSLKLLGGKLAPKLVYFDLRKELFNFNEMHPDFMKISMHCCNYRSIIVIRKLWILKRVKWFRILV